MNIAKLRMRRLPVAVRKDQLPPQADRGSSKHVASNLDTLPCLPLDVAHRDPSTINRRPS